MKNPNVKISGTDEQKCLKFGYKYTLSTTEYEQHCFVCTYEVGYIPNYDAAVAIPTKEIVITDITLPTTTDLVLPKYYAGFAQHSGGWRYIRP